MTLQEAIKTGKPFKRPEHPFWITTFQNYFYVYRDPNIKVARVSFEFEVPSKIGESWHRCDWRFDEPGLPIPVILLVGSVLADDWKVKKS